jgi:hypothetical protein
MTATELLEISKSCWRKKKQGQTTINPKANNEFQIRYEHKSITAIAIAQLRQITSNNESSFMPFKLATNTGVIKFLIEDCAEVS